MKKQTAKIFGKIILSVSLAACGGAGAANTSNSTEPQPMPVGALLTEYKQSKDATVKKYTGKNLIVKGYTSIAPIMPTGADDAGILTLIEKGSDQSSYLTCQFRQSDKAGFEKIKGDQTVSVTGVFDDSISTALKNCQVVKVD